METPRLPMRANTNHVFEVAPDVPPRVLRLVPQCVPAAGMGVEGTGEKREEGWVYICK